VVQLIEDRKLLGNAIALNSTLFNSARLMGPTLAGILIAAVGESVCFLANALSYLAAVAALLAMRLPEKKKEGAPMPLWEGLRTGVDYVAGFRPLRKLILFFTLISLAGMPYGVLLPVYASDILHGGPKTLGFLTTCTGLGALSGAVFLAQRRGVRGLAKFLPLGMGLLGLGIVAFAWSRTLWLSMLVLVFASFGNMIGIASGNTILQTVVEDDKRGRVVSFFAMSMMGMAPFGGFLFGMLASRLGAPLTLTLGGFVTLGCSLAFAVGLKGFRAEIRAAYQERGILEGEGGG
jgi:MFS family permease